MIEETPNIAKLGREEEEKAIGVVKRRETMQRKGLTSSKVESYTQLQSITSDHSTDN